MISLSLLKGFVIKEFKQTLRDKRMRVMLFIAPVIQLTVFGLALSNDVKNIRLWTLPEPKDTILQHVYDRAIASRWFLPVQVTYQENPMELLRAGKIDAALIAPPGGFTRAVGRGAAELQLLVNATNVIEAQAIESYVKSIVDEVLKTDLHPPTAHVPIQFVIRILFNPDLETSIFMVPGVLCLLLCIITIVLTSASITREKEMGTFEMLISAPITAMDVILGKTIPFIILGMIEAPLILVVAVFGFNVPLRGPLFLLLLVVFVFVCTAVAIGTLISTFAQNQKQSILGGFLFLFPAILLSGLLFPTENMPEVLKILSFLDPLSHIITMLRNIMLKGGDVTYLTQHSLILLLMAVVLTIISYKRFHTTLQ